MVVQGVSCAEGHSGPILKDKRFLCGNKCSWISRKLF